MRRKGYHSKLCSTEDQELMALIAWARMRDIPLVHHANERVCSAHSGAIMKRKGVSSGYPDISLNQARGGYFGLFIELKRKCTYTPSQRRTKTWLAQEEWLTRLSKEHYYSIMCYGWDAAREIVERYLSWPRTTFRSQANEHA